ncbi:inositol-trisphosphate 3-kinase B-like isoform X2 [Hemiscyllium ocellatum]|uniref:inositol-trisphosphate 3-kinase B-like isoform X2 n=1 Tax=Hemiscyllium ocellatum TaxID=170820 RepID=UPI0029673BEB|nr:inositol-trisphosphate 3-kinase B-like isoform X2 [Hemiscyllium ocellatum]
MDSGGGESRDSQGSPLQVPGDWETLPPQLEAKCRLRTSSSSVSSFNCSSAESEDEVFSDGAPSSRDRRQLLRKMKSWKAFFTMVHWTYRRSNSWIQLAGHEGHFRPSEAGYILKKFSVNESECLQKLMGDVLKPYVPAYYGLVEKDSQHYIQMEDLLTGLHSPCIMDCKMGIRTYLEEELMKDRQKGSYRKDLYQKMKKVDPQAPTEQEHREAGVTKMDNGVVLKDFKQTRTKEQIMAALIRFTNGCPLILKAYENRLNAIKAALLQSPFFSCHEFIGSSLLFIHERKGRVNVWMIDFGKTTTLPEGHTLQHNRPWEEGNREDGYLLGLDNLLGIFSATLAKLENAAEPGGEVSERPLVHR